MLIPTRNTTADDIIKADLERVEQARWGALCEMYADLLKVRDFAGFALWTDAVNKRAFEILKRLN